MTIFYFLRHADARAGNIRHDSKFPLTDLGKYQAKKTGLHFSNTEFDACVGSPAKRVRQTLEIVAEDTPIFINNWNILREIKRSVDGLKYEDVPDYSIERDKAIENREKNWKYVSTDESFWEIFLRACEIKYQLLKEFKDQVCLVGGHSQVFSMLHTSFEYGDEPSSEQLFTGFNKFFLKPAAYSEVTWNYRKGWTIKSFNKISHLNSPASN